MDAAIAGLLGAGIGVVGTLSTAFVTGHLAGRNQYKQWQYENRRAAYSELIGKINDLYHLAVAVTDAATGVGLYPVPDDTAVLVDEMQQVARAVRSALPAVMMVGADEVSQLSREIHQNLPGATSDVALSLRFSEPDMTPELRDTLTRVILGGRQILFNWSRDLVEATRRDLRTGAPIEGPLNPVRPPGR